MDTILFTIGVVLLLGSIAGYFYVKIRLKPKDPDLDDYYCEFEDEHPEVARYNKWLNLTMSAIALAVLLLFLAAAI